MHFLPSRRDFLHVGFLGGLGLTLPQFLQMQQARADLKAYESTEGTAKSVIFIFMPGGMAHQETFDPKPYAPIEYRGPMNSIETNVPGTRLNEILKQTAQVTDKLAICRSMTHGEAAHERGTHNMFTGYRPSPALSFPSMGSVVTHEFPSKNNLPQYVCIPNQPNEFAGTGYLSSSYAAFSLGSDPAAKGFTVKDLKLPGGVDDTRFTRRRTVLSAVNDHFVSKEKADSLDAVDSFYQRAYSLVSSEKAREAFNINAEPDAIRDEYGRNAAGARMLLARRLCEAGSRFVTMTYGSWDMHDNINGGIRGQLPAFDQAYAALIRDLDRRGTLKDTLVCIASEFGRTPKINKNISRDHWPRCYTALLAGGGVKGGAVYGESDKYGAVPDRDPVSTGDLTATMYNLLGIDHTTEIHDNFGRPLPIANGRPVTEVFA